MATALHLIVILPRIPFMFLGFLFGYVFHAFVAGMDLFSELAQQADAYFRGKSRL